MTQRLAVRPLSRALLGCLAVSLVPIVPGQAQQIGRLYDPRPPEGSAFIRVITVDGTPDVVIQGKKVVRSPATAAATRYVALPADVAPNITVNGQRLSGLKAPAPNHFVSLVASPTGGAVSVTAIDEGNGGGDDLKAQLRFFNLVQGCAARLGIKDGPEIFSEVGPMSLRGRAVNPVKASLVAACSSNRAEFALPQLKPGDHFSVFLLPASSGVALTGQFDETEPTDPR